MAAAAGRKDAVSLSLFHGGEHFVGVDEELSTLATLFWVVCVDGNMAENAAEHVEAAHFRGADMEAGERICRGSFVRDP